MQGTNHPFFRHSSEVRTAAWEAQKRTREIFIGPLGRFNIALKELGPWVIHNGELLRDDEGDF